MYRILKQSEQVYHGAQEFIGMDMNDPNHHIHIRHLSLVPNCPFYGATCAVNNSLCIRNLIGYFSFDDFLIAMTMGEIRWTDARMVSL